MDQADDSLDTELRLAQRDLAMDPNGLPDYLTALARSNRLLVEAGSRPLVLVQVRLMAKGTVLRRHPWPTQRGRRPDGGRWWTPGRGSSSPGRRRSGDPARVYLLPSTDNGHAWWSDDLAVAFDHAEDLIEWLAPRIVEWKELPPSGA